MTASASTMPGALVLVRKACHQYGTTRFLFGPRSALQALDAQRQRASILPSATGKPLYTPPKRPTPGPTRLSARGKQSASSAQTSASTRLLRVGTTVLRYGEPCRFSLYSRLRSKLTSLLYSAAVRDWVLCVRDRIGRSQDRSVNISFHIPPNGLTSLVRLALGCTAFEDLYRNADVARWTE